jgi:hypothetical protein
VQTLSAFLGQPAPKAAPAIDFLKPLTPEQEKTSLEFFNQLNFLLGFAPTVPVEEALRAKFASIGIVSNKTIDFSTMSPEMKAAYQGGMADAWETFNQFKVTEFQTGKVTSGDVFGSRAT